MPSDLEFVIMRGLHHSIHFLEGHAERVVIIRVWRSGIAGGISFHPLDAVLYQSPNGGACFLDSVDDEDEALHTDFPELRIPVH